MWSLPGVDLLPFLAVSAVVILTPGVDVAVVTQQVLARGRRAGLGAVAGIVAGSAVPATAAVLGIERVTGAVLVGLGVRLAVDA